MNDLDAARAVEAALPHLSIRDVLILLAERADTLRDDYDTAGDKAGRARAASDHRQLLNLKEKIYH